LFVRSFASAPLLAALLLAALLAALLLATLLLGALRCCWLRCCREKKYARTHIVLSTHAIHSLLLSNCP